MFEKRKSPKLKGLRAHSTKEMSCPLQEMAEKSKRKIALTITIRASLTVIIFFH